MPQASHKTLVVNAAEFHQLIQADELFAGRTQDPNAIVALDGSKCAARTTDGVMWTGSAANCVDLGVGNASSNHWQFEYLPTPSHVLGRPPPTEQQLLRDRLQTQMSALQFTGGAQGSPRGCGVAQNVYFINDVPKVGFGSVIEYGLMFLARAVTLRKQLVFGPRSSPAWTSDYFCGPEARSLSCYFSVSSCDALLHVGDEPSEELPLALMPRRRNPLNIGLAGFNTYGSAWVSAELATFFFSRMTAPTAAEVRKRRASVGFPRRGVGFGSERVIGVHIRGGDSCAARRYCPANKTIYFEEAARLRLRYGANRVLLATDNAEAAALCRAGVLGFECRTLPMDRSKFESSTFIENRVQKHAEGALSGAAVALDTLADMDMLADCDMHVLLLRSAVSRLAYALALARRGQPTPLLSLQWPWGPGFHKSKTRMRLRGRGGAKPGPRLSAGGGGARAPLAVGEAAPGIV